MMAVYNDEELKIIRPKLAAALAILQQLQASVSWIEVQRRIALDKKDRTKAYLDRSLPRQIAVPLQQVAALVEEYGE
jgi:hypothetical protein